jgi:hypothetical protein
VVVAHSERPLSPTKYLGRHPGALVAAHVPLGVDVRRRRRRLERCGLLDGGSVAEDLAEVVEEILRVAPVRGERHRQAPGREDAEERRLRGQLDQSLPTRRSVVHGGAGWAVRRRRHPE